MSLLLDTHLIIWWQGDRQRVPSTVQTLIEESPDVVYVSLVSLWEMAIKVSQKKLQVDLDDLCRNITNDGFQWLPVENRHILQVATLPLFDDHKDPFDRLLVAQSLTEPTILLTANAKLARYGSTVRVVVS
jgi:PIN domain nuclease of toxin-antitoxin system